MELLSSRNSKEIYSNPNTKFVAEFIGSPQMNLFDCSIENGVAKLGEGQINLDNSININDASIEYDLMISKFTDSG